MAPNITVKPADLKEMVMVQNMARFYLYDVSRWCGQNPGWEIPEDGLYECFSLRKYFIQPNHEAYLIRVNQEVAGFIMLDKEGVTTDIDWCIAEFFVLAKFQGQGVGAAAVNQIWKTHPGLWEVRVLPDNISALHFWRKVIRAYVGDAVKEVDQIVQKPDIQRKIVFTFKVEEGRIKHKS